VVNQVTSVNEKSENSQSTHLCESQAKTNEILKNVESIQVVGLCDNSPILNNDLSSAENLSKESGKEDEDSEPENLIVESKAYHNSDEDDDDDHDLLEPSSLSLNLGNVKDIIIGDIGFKLNCEDQTKQVLSTEPEQVQLLFCDNSYDSLFDELNDKKEIESSKNVSLQTERKVNKSLVVNQVTSVNEKSENSQSTHLCESQAKANEILKNNESIQIVGLCDYSPILNSDLSSAENLSKESGKEDENNDSEHLTVESNSDEDYDDDHNLLEPSSLSLNLGNVKDVIIKENDFKLSCDNNIYDLLDALNEEKKIVSSKNADQKPKRRCEMKQVNSQILMSQDQISDEKIPNTATSFLEVLVSSKDQTNNAKNCVIIPDTEKGSRTTNSNILTKNKFLKKVTPKRSKNNLGASKKTLDSPESNIKPIPKSPSSLVTNMRNRLVSLVSCKPLLPTVKVSNEVTHRELTPLTVPASTQNEQAHETMGEGSIKPQTTASEQNLAENISKPMKYAHIEPTDLNSSNVQPQTNRTALRKNSSDLNHENIGKSIKQADLNPSNIHSKSNITATRKRSYDSDESEDGKKRRLSNDVQTGAENQKVDVNNHSRRSARIPKKKFCFDL
jgi:hypothetical protein